MSAGCKSISMIPTAMIDRREWTRLLCHWTRIEIAVAVIHVADRLVARHLRRQTKGRRSLSGFVVIWDEGGLSVTCYPASSAVSVER